MSVVTAHCYQLLATGYWLLATGYWLLATGLIFSLTPHLVTAV